MVKPSAVAAIWEYILSTSWAHFKSSLPSLSKKTARKEKKRQTEVRLNSEAYLPSSAVWFFNSVIASVDIYLVL